MRLRIWQWSCIFLSVSISLAHSLVGEEFQSSYYETAAIQVAQQKLAPVQIQAPYTKDVEAPPEPVQSPPSTIQAPLVPADEPTKYDLDYSCVNAAPSCDLACGDSSCDASCGACTTYCDCYCPLWTIRAGAIFLRRDGQDDFTLTNGATPIGLGSLAFDDYQPGPLVTVMRHNILGTPSTLEVTYFGVQDSTTAASAGATLVFTNPNLNFGPADVTATYRSRLDSGEINIRRDWSDWFTFLYGFRWVELNDELTTDISTGPSTHLINVNNHLYGAQIGADAILYRCGAFSVESFIKAGIYGNSADQTTTIVNVGGTVPNFGAGDSRTAFLGELAVTGVYDLTDHWSIRGGYQALWFDGIALAPDQLAVSDVSTGVATLNDDGNPIYHGFTVAAQYSW
jgi:hypothetical protein